MEFKTLATPEATDAIQYLKETRARKLYLPSQYVSRYDVQEAIASNRAITTLEMCEREVCLLLFQ
jgi:hypothetical protein